MIVVILFLNIFTEKRQSRERAYQSSCVANAIGSFTVRKEIPHCKVRFVVVILTIVV